MIMMKRVFEMTGELAPDIDKKNVWSYMQDKMAEKESFNFLVVEDWQETHVVLNNLYSIGNFSIENDATIQEEKAVLCFQTNTLYLSVENNYPDEEKYNSVEDMYSLDRIKSAGIKVTEFIPEYLTTPYSDI